MKKVNKETLRMQMLAGIITEEQHTPKLNVSDIISRLYQDLSNKHSIKISDLLISLNGDKLYCYTQDDFGYLTQLDVVSLNDL